MIWAIGDIQGCWRTLKKLLDKIEFERSDDRLWIAGDLVNRGDHSLEVLRWAKANADRLTIVLGNHDLHLLACHASVRRSKARDTLDEVLAAPDRDELMDWLRHQPLMIRDGNHVMVHAGFLPRWKLETALERAGELEDALRGDRWKDVLAASYVRPVPQWHKSLEGDERYASLVHVLTRMRICDKQGRMDLSYKLGDVPKGYRGWFEHKEHKRPPEITVYFGHWSALGFYKGSDVVCLDSGCVWGGKLTAYRLDDGHVVQQKSAES